MVRGAQSQRACVDRSISSIRRSAKPLRVTRRIDAQSQKRLQNGRFLHMQKELCGRFS
jgi:hypothetical protein